MFIIGHMMLRLYALRVFYAERRLTMKHYFVILPALFLSGCCEQPPSYTQISQAYQNAVQDASVATNDEIANNLIAITPSNQKLIWNADKSKIKVVTWKSQASYEQHIKPKTHTNPDQNCVKCVTWVSTAPEVQAFCQNYQQSHQTATKEDLDLRLKQYLGLRSDWQYDVFVEMWVSPDDLFRPCPDTETTDTSCSIRLPAPSTKGIQDYAHFYKELYFLDFGGLPSNPVTPWTGLGYTYDWGNPASVKGASEFILNPNTPYEIIQVFSTMDYCNHD